MHLYRFPPRPSTDACCFATHEHWYWRQNEYATKTEREDAGRYRRACSLGTSARCREFRLNCRTKCKPWRKEVRVSQCSQKWSAPDNPRHLALFFNGHARRYCSACIVGRCYNSPSWYFHSLRGKSWNKSGSLVISATKYARSHSMVRSSTWYRSIFNEWMSTVSDRYSDQYRYRYRCIRS